MTTWGYSQARKPPALSTLRKNRRDSQQRQSKSKLRNGFVHWHSLIEIYWNILTSHRSRWSCALTFLLQSNHRWSFEIGVEICGNTIDSRCTYKSTIVIQRLISSHRYPLLLSTTQPNSTAVFEILTDRTRDSMACSPQVVDTLNIHHLWSYVKVKAYKFMKVCKWVRILYADKIGRDHTSSKWQLDSYPFNHLQPTSSLVKQIDLHNLHRMIKIRKGGPVTILSIPSPQANWSKSIGHGTVQLVIQNLKFSNERSEFGVPFRQLHFQKKPSRNFKVCFHAVLCT